MKNFDTPLVLDCEGLSSKLILELADELRDFFDVVDINDEEISADVLIDKNFVGDAQAVINRYGVRILP